MLSAKCSTNAAVDGALEAAGADLEALSRFLWSNPEVACHEVKAHEAVADLLERHGFRVQRQTPTPTAFVARSGNDPATGDAPLRPHVAIMCEYDALPEVGHACGHNLIATSAVGAGLAVRAALLASGAAGRVSVLGTPAEETGGGKVDFIEAGLLADVDAAMMVHPVGGGRQRLVLNLKTTAVQDFVVQFHGRAAHAAGCPWEAVNALDAAVQAYQSVAQLRQHIPRDCRAAGVITDGGAVPNVIPDRTEMVFTLRAPHQAAMAALQPRWRACMEAAATATGCSVRVEAKSRPYAALVNNGRLAEAFKANAEAVGMATEAEERTGGSTDMGNVSEVVPSIHPCFPLETAADCHMKAFAEAAGSPVGLRLALQQARIIAMTALDVLTDPELRREMEREFAEWKASN